MARRLIVVLASSVAAMLACGSSAVAELRTRDSGQRFIPGEALVRFEPGVVAAERREARDGAGVAFGESLLLPRIQLVKFRGSVRAAVARLERQPGVAYAQPNFRYHALAAPPNDTHFAQLWGLGGTPGVGALAAWDVTRGAGQIIAVADTGVDLTHPDLQGNLWTGPGGIHGRDFVDADDDPSDFESHGTHVTGTAAAVANNNQGVAGVAPEAQIMAVRVLDGDGGGNSGDIANGIAFAADNGAGVVNLSLGGPGNASPDTAMGQAVTFAATRGTVVVAAAGNGGSDGVGDDNDATPNTPCNLPQDTLICVAALDDAGGLAGYSNFGATSVDVGAPGGDPSQGTGQQILSSKPAWVTKFNENFEAIDEWSASGTGVAWGIEGPVGSRVASDSPGVPYQNNTSSQLATTAPVSLTGQGCRLRFDFLIDTAGPGDFMTVGVDTATGLLALDLTGNDVDTVEASISEVDGESVTPTLQFTSDGAGVDTGGLVDDYRLACRGGAPGDYDDEIVDPDLFDLSASPGGGSYMAISGTSMATPHVAGVAALVQAADPGVPPAQIVQAIKESVTPLASLSGVTSAGGAVNALPAIQRALALPNTAPPPPPPPPPPPTPPGKARIGSVSINKRGVLTIRVRGDAGTTGVLTLTANITRASRIRRVGRKSFRIGSTRRARVRVKLSRPAFRQLKRTRRLRLRARVVLKNAAGLRSTSTTGIRIRLRRR